VRLRQREQKGHLFKAYGSWHIRFWVAYTDLHINEKERIARKCERNGKPLPGRVQKSTKLCDGELSRRAARDLAEKKMDEVNGHLPGELVIPVLTLATYWEKHYLPWAESNLKPSTLHGYKQVFHQHLSRHFGSTGVKEITTPMATKMLGEMAQDEQGGRTITHAKWVASSVYKHAIATGFASYNPWPNAQCLVKTPRPPETKAYSITEALAIIAVLDRLDTKLAFALACFNGLRKGEIRGLRWEDFVGDEVLIRRALSRNVVMDETKTGKARRGLIIEPVKSLLAEWRELWGNPSEGWLFPNGADHPMSLDSMAQRLIIPKLTKDLRWEGWQACRRGAGTILTELTGDALAARDILGRSTTKVTESHYIADIPVAGRKGMALLEARVLAEMQKGKE
jgi:integrase